MYTKWYELPIDNTPFLKAREYLSFKAQKASNIYIESNPYLALSIRELADFFPFAHFLITIRDPRKVVLSHLNKGWYKEYSPCFRPSMFKAPGYDYQIQQGNHFFGRIVPKNQPEFEHWLKLSQVGKISWMWQEINSQIWSQLEYVAPERYSIITLEDFNFDGYISIMNGLQLSPFLANDEFQKFVDKKPGKSRIKKFLNWGEIEEKEFQEQIHKFPYLNTLK